MSEAYEPRAGHLPRSLLELERVCRDLGFGFTIIDTHSRQLVRIDNRHYQVFAGIGRIQNYPLNSATAASIARDKAFTYQTVAAAGIAVPPYGVFFLDTSRTRLRGPGRERADAFAYAHALGYPVFVKPLDGALGAFAGPATCDAELDGALDAISSRHHAALVQPVFKGAEWRLFLVDGAARFAYRREPPVLSGDGVRTIAEILAHRSAQSEGLGVTLPAADSLEIRAALRARSLTPRSILPEGQALALSSAANVSRGGTIAEFTDSPPAAWSAWAAAIMDALTLRVGAIDFFVAGNELILLEVNHTPDLAGIIAAGHAECARAIWHDVLTTYFAEAAARGG